MIFWYKSCASFFDEPDSGTIVFPCSPSLVCVARSPSTLFRATIPTQPHLERARLDARKTMFCRSIRHVWQHETANANGNFLPFYNNPLITNDLHNWSENRVYPPNRFVVAANNVDSNIDCCQNSHPIPTSPPYIPNRSSDRDKSPPHGPKTRNGMKWLATG